MEQVAVLVDLALCLARQAELLYVYCCNQRQLDDKICMAKSYVLYSHYMKIGLLRVPITDITDIKWCIII